MTIYLYQGDVPSLLGRGFSELEGLEYLEARGHHHRILAEKGGGFVDLGILEDLG